MPRSAPAVLAFALLAGSASAQVVAKHAMRAWPSSPEATSEDSPGYWDKQYPMGYQAGVYYQLGLEVPSIAKADAEIGKRVEAAGGRLLSANSNFNPAWREPSAAQRNYQYELSDKKAEALAKKLFALGTLQRYSAARQMPPELLAEISRKIELIEKEQASGAKALESLPVARSLLGSALARLRQARDAYQAVSDKAILNVSLTSSAPETTAANRTDLEKEGRAKGDLGAIRSALAIYYGDTEGHYPPDLAALTVNQKYLTRIPALDLPKHKPSDKVRVLTRVRDAADLDSQLKDSGQWLYVADPGSPMDGTLLIDCTHSDSRGTAWKSY